jgi:hypothetical protein
MVDFFYESTFFRWGLDYVFAQPSPATHHVLRFTLHPPPQQSHCSEKQVLRTCDDERLQDDVLEKRLVHMFVLALAYAWRALPAKKLAGLGKKERPSLHRITNVALNELIPLGQSLAGDDEVHFLYVDNLLGNVFPEDIVMPAAHVWDGVAFEDYRRCDVGLCEFGGGVAEVSPAGCMARPVPSYVNCHPPNHLQRQLQKAAEA